MRGVRRPDSLFWLQMPPPGRMSLEEAERLQIRPLIKGGADDGGQKQPQSTPTEKQMKSLLHLAEI